MVATKQINIQNRTYYFYNDLINIKDFDPKLLKLDKKSFNDISMYYIGYVTKNPEYLLLVGEIDGFIEEKKRSKNFNFSITDINSEVLKKYAMVWSGNKDQIKKIKNGKLEEYGKDYIKIK